MNDLIIYRESDPNFLKKIKYYQKLGITGVIINPFYEINDKILDDLFKANTLLHSLGIDLFVEIDVIDITKILVKYDDIDLRYAKFRNVSYQFISYLKRHGISNFYFTNVDDVFLVNGSFDYNVSQEFIKNTMASKDINSIINTDIKDRNILNYLSNPNLSHFDIVEINDDYSYDFVEYKNLLIEIHEKSKTNNISKSLSINNPLRAFLNFDNYPYKSHSLVAGISYFLKGIPIISDFEELGIFNFDASKNEVNLLNKSNQTLDFYKNIFSARHKHDVLREGSFSMLLEKDPDIISYMRLYNEKKLIVFGNFSQREMLCDMRFRFIDLYDYKYLLGNYGYRTIVKNLLLRPYEFVAFIKEK